MKVRVEIGRFLSVPCDDREYLVFDRKEGKYHLLPESAARLWERIQEGGRFELGPGDEPEPLGMLVEVGLVEVPQRATDPARKSAKVEGSFHYRGRKVPLPPVFGS
jgi:hypothetical protein